MSEMRISSHDDLALFREELVSKASQSQLAVSVCMSTGCVALGSHELLDALKKEITNQNLSDKVVIKETGCLGFCEKGPRVTIYPSGISYFQVKPSDMHEIVSTLSSDTQINRLLYKDHTTGKTAHKLSEIPFYKLQRRLLLSDNERVDPKKIEDYISIGGYSALSKVLKEMTPDTVIDVIKKSKLRGRGGGGFPTGPKWESTRIAIGEPKYVIVNCDEGDPGAFMDRALMEGNPHKILEGLIIGAYAMGASKGYIYVRDEYPIALQNIKIAISQARNRGLIGNNILGSGFSFDVKIQAGAGAFVSGESSALIEAVEGRVGEPKPKYIHTAEKGVKGKPTCLNNVKTWANVPMIILNGDKWFRSIGTEGSSGTNIFSLVGNVNNTGLVEVPMGVTLRDLVYTIGGGVRGGKKFKAVQTGGPSGGFIPEKHLDLPVDFDALASVGSMMGSGGMVIMDEGTCMVDSARYFVDFLLEESCGKCIPCREGLRVLSKTLNNICSGKGSVEDMKTIRDVTEVMEVASMCSLGKTAVNPVLTSMKYFEEEWKEHIEDKICRAKRCKELIKYQVNQEKCKSCLQCVSNCPTKAITAAKKQPAIIDQGKCIKCGICLDVCKFESIEKVSGTPLEQTPSVAKEE